MVVPRVAGTAAAIIDCVVAWAIVIAIAIVIKWVRCSICRWLYRCGRQCGATATC